MPTLLRSRSFARALPLVLAGTAALGGCQATGAAGGGTSSPSSAGAAPLTPTAAVADAGTITLTDEDCTWHGNPGSMSEGRLTVAVRNTTDDHAVFILHKLHASKAWEDGRAAIAAIQEALTTGAEWPPEVSDAVTESAAEAGSDGSITIAATAGTFGIVCSADDSSTGEILTVFLVGPLEVTS